ncbi:hypothetical protein [Amycolatopsis saalfeldensis]|nr:hypothetical protein [Amycolatopsis saalfeldensis]
MNELTTPGQNAPAPGSPPVPLPVVGQTTTSGPPPDFTALGAGQAKADFAAAAGNGGWKFDAAAMDKVIQQLEDSLDSDYSQARTIGYQFAQLGYPGSDGASKDYMTAAGRATTAYNEFLRGTVDYLQSYVETLKQIRTAYVKQDQAAIDAFRGPGKVV